MKTIPEIRSAILTALDGLADQIELLRSRHDDKFNRAMVELGVARIYVEFAMQQLDETEADDALISLDPIRFV